MHSLIGPEDHWALWAVLCGAAAFGLWAERTRWGSRLAGAVVVIATFPGVAVGRVLGP